MSDLTGKFAAIETQLTTQHSEIMEALNTIAFALGAPPTTPSTNLADVVEAITTSNGLLTDIFNTVDSINNNASLNAQRLLTLLLQTACPCDDTIPLLPPPLDTLPTELEAEAKCQRIQYFLDLFSNWVILVVVYLNDNGSISSFQINNLLSGVLLDVGITSSELNGMPTQTRDNLTMLLSTAGSPAAINASIFDEITNGTVIVDMRQALYGADNATDGKDAADTAIASSGGAFANIITAMFYSSWPNVMYGAVPEVDASGYDGTICAPAETCTWITTGDRPDVNIFFDEAHPWDDVGSGEKCDVTITLLSGAVNCRMIVNGTVVVEWTPAPQHFEFDGPGSFQVLLSGTGHVSELFRVCQTGL